MSNLQIDVKYPHMMIINAHSINNGFFAINFAQDQALAGVLKSRGAYPIVYIDAHLNKEQAKELIAKLTEFVEGK